MFVECAWLNDNADNAVIQNVEVSFLISLSFLSFQLINMFYLDS